MIQIKVSHSVSFWEERVHGGEKVNNIPRVDEMTRKKVKKIKTPSYLLRAPSCSVVWSLDDSTENILNLLRLSKTALGYTISINLSSTYYWFINTLVISMIELMSM